MSENIKNIKWFSIITAVFLVLTYIFSIVEFKCDLISSNFLFTVFGGVFASFCVVLIMEIIKYRLNKKVLENSIYQNLLIIYNLLKLEIQYSSIYKDNKNLPVPENLYTNNAQILNSYCCVVKYSDYCLLKNTVLLKEVKRFQSDELPLIETHVRKGGFLGIAILQTKINMQNTCYSPTFCDSLVSTAINNMISDAEVRCKAIESILSVLSSSYPKRFDWKKDKAASDEIKVDINTMYAPTAEFFKA